MHAKPSVTLMPSVAPHTVESSLTFGTHGSNSGPDLQHPTRRTLRRNDEIVTIEERNRVNERWAVITPQPGSANLTAPFIHSAVGVARQLFGNDIRIVSPAVTNDELATFLDAGFRIRTNLHLLVLELGIHSLAHTPSRRSGIRITKFRTNDISNILLVDQSAFGIDSSMDFGEFSHAIRATPSTYVRIAMQNSELVGFSIFGRAGRRGYLQRLAVHPQQQGHGIGRLLIMDGLRWCRRRQVQRVVVNTEHGNERALHLYESLGFVRSSMGLHIAEHLLANTLDSPQSQQHSVEPRSAAVTP